MKKLTVSIMLSLLLAMAGHATGEQEKWEGVDKAVIEKAAEEQGRGAVNTPLNSLEGDSLLFAFLAGGALGGFAAGYYYRKLTGEGGRDE